MGSRRSHRGSGNDLRGPAFPGDLPEVPLQLDPSSRSLHATPRSHRFNPPSPGFANAASHSHRFSSPASGFATPRSHRFNPLVAPARLAVPEQQHVSEAGSDGAEERYIDETSEEAKRSEIQRQRVESEQRRRNAMRKNFGRLKDLLPVTETIERRKTSNSSLIERGMPP